MTRYLSFDPDSTVTAQADAIRASATRVVTHLSGWTTPASLEQAAATLRSVRRAAAALELEIRAKITEDKAEQRSQATAERQCASR